MVSTGGNDYFIFVNDQIEDQQLVIGKTVQEILILSSSRV